MLITTSSYSSQVANELQLQIDYSCSISRQSKRKTKWQLVKPVVEVTFSDAEVLP